MQSGPPVSANRPALVDPHVLGTICGLFSAVVYTGANGFLRALESCDPVWVSAIKATPTTLIMIPVVVALALRGQKVLPTLPIFAMTIAGGMAGQLGGNISFQWALGQIGLALTVPLSLGGMIVAAAIMGRVFLYEPVTPKVVVALGLLLAAIAVLSYGAGEAGRFMLNEQVSVWRVALGVAAACLSGTAYAVLNVIMRYCIMRGAPMPTMLLTVSVVGLLSLGFLAWLRIGQAGILATTPGELGLMLAAGLCNTVAFVSLTKSLQLTSVVYVNALSAIQAMLAALVGVFVFQEKLTSGLAIGVALTIGGLMALANAHRAIRAVGEA